MPNKLRSLFGHYVRQRRIKKHLTIRAFANRMQMPYGNLFQIETAVRNPRITDLEKLAKALDQSLDKFLKDFLKKRKKWQTS